MRRCAVQGACRSRRLWSGSPTPRWCAIAGVGTLTCKRVLRTAAQVSGSVLLSAQVLAELKRVR